MALRYKGIPDVGSNRVADSVVPICFCKFVAVGMPLNAKACDTHEPRLYPCGRCSCMNYRPSEVKKYPAHWPLCTCGHIAQEHD